MSAQLSKDILGLVAAHLGIDVTPVIVKILQAKVTRLIGGPAKKGRNETPVPCANPTEGDWRAFISSGVEAAATAAVQVCWVYLLYSASLPEFLANRSRFSVIALIA